MVFKQHVRIGNLLGKGDALGAGAAAKGTILAGLVIASIMRYVPCLPLTFGRQFSTVFRKRGAPRLPKLVRSAF